MLAVSVTLKVAVLDPVPLGVNETLIVHEVPFDTVAPHVVEATAKSALFAPLNAMLEMFIVLPLLFVSVTSWEALVLPRF